MTVESEKLQRLNAASDAPIRANISMSMHPRMLGDHGPTLVDLEHSGTSIDAYGAGRAALKALYDSASQIDAAHQSMSKALPVVGAVAAKGSAPIMRVQIPPERAPELASAMATSASRAAANVERNLDVVDKSIAKLNDFIRQKTSNPRANETATAHEAAQIREYVKGLADPSRQSSFLQSAVKDGDAPVVFAVLRASPFASGLNRQQHDILKGFAEEKFANTELRQRNALLDVKKKIESGMAAYATEYSKRLPRVANDPSAASMAALKGAA